MSENKNSLECNAICWGVAAIIGLVSMVMLWMLAEFTFLQAIFTGGLIGFLLGVILSIFVCRGQKAAADLAATEKPAQLYAREAAEQKAERESRAPVAAPTATAGGAGAAEASVTAGGDSSGGAAAAGDASGASASTATAASDGASGAASNTTPSSFASSGVAPSATLAGEAELASRKGTWKYEGGDAAPAKSTSAAPAAVPEPAAAPKAEKAAAEPAKAAAATPEASSSSLEGASSDGDSPLLFSAPPAGGADDLKLISGVGPKLEGTLNEMGIYRFAQVAVWGPKDIAWVDDRLRFKGRIERDDWMSQAKILADGGETEFSKRKK